MTSSNKLERLLHLVG